MLSERCSQKKKKAGRSWVLDWQPPPPPSISETLFYFLLPSIVSDEKSTFTQTVIRGFWFFGFQYFCLFLNSLWYVWGMNFIGLIIPSKVHRTSCSYRFKFFIKLRKFSASISSNIFFLHHILSALLLGVKKMKQNVRPSIVP